VRPLPRLHAVTDAAILALEDFPVRAAALAAAGSAVALHARARGAPVRRLLAVAERLGALARPAEAALFVNARPDVAAACHAQGAHLGQDDLSPADARRATSHGWRGWIGVSVHSLAEAETARAAGADYLMLGAIYESVSHPGRPAAGLDLVGRVAALGLPVIAIGGVTPQRAVALRDAGAYGVAAISAAWLAPDPAEAAIALLAPWREAA
jgi:thiamine-phosphate pyrophosphorylase